MFFLARGLGQFSSIRAHSGLFRPGSPESGQIDLRVGVRCVVVTEWQTGSRCLFQ
jgi:hypothetical protein